MNKIRSIALGKAGELRVASELLLRGNDVYFNSADSGVDLILGSGKKIQVKVAYSSAVKDYWECRRYVFSFKSWRKVDKHYEPHNLAGVDYVILWAINDNVFFVIPAEKIRGRLAVSLNPISTKQQSEYMLFKDKWDSLK